MEKQSRINNTGHRGKRRAKRVWWFETQVEELLDQIGKKQ